MRSRDTAILLHLRGNSQQAASELNGIMQSIDPSIPYYDVETLKSGGTTRRWESASIRSC